MFNIGDKVLCVKGSFNHIVRNPIIGKVYTLEEEHGDTLLFTEDILGFDSSWFIPWDTTKASKLEKLIYGVGE